MNSYLQAGLGGTPAVLLNYMAHGVREYIATEVQYVVVTTLVDTKINYLKGYGEQAGLIPI